MWRSRHFHIRSGSWKRNWTSPLQPHNETGLPHRRRRISAGRNRADPGRRRRRRPRCPPDRRRPQWAGTAGPHRDGRLLVSAPHRSIGQAGAAGVALEIQADMLTPVQCDSLRAGSLDWGCSGRPRSARASSCGPSTSSRLCSLFPSITGCRSSPSSRWPTCATSRSWHMRAVTRRSTRRLLRSCRQAGFVPHREHAAPGTAVLLALVAAGLGVAVVPESVRALPLDGLVFRDLVDAGSIELALAWRSGEDNPASKPSSAFCKPHSKSTLSQPNSRPEDRRERLPG